MTTAAPAMSPTIFDAIVHLPEGGALLFQRVSWDEYEKLVEKLGARYRARLSYDHGRLEINMPLPIHEDYKEFISHLMRALTDELELDMQALGSTTFQYEPWLQGLEPDTCFYIQNAARVIGIRRFDPKLPPPPPDIAVEIDITSESLGRFPIYANLGVPEIWRYDEQQVRMYHLTEVGYAQAPASRAFPFLTAEALGQFLERSLTEGQSASLREFRQWVRAQQTTTP
ncbi:MAG: Uma2 family endonuclease [Acidobacteriota bacterium]|nr:Uma2 family endonuclease [Acidobacteriota bacterium]